MWSIVLATVAIIQLVLCTVALISADGTHDSLRNLYWSKVDQDGVKSYWSLFSVYEDTSYYWSGTLEYSSCDEDICNNCAIAGQVVTSFLVITIVVLLVVITLHILRCFPSLNTHTLKVGTIIGSVASFLLSLLAIIIWAGQCQANLFHKWAGADITVGSAFGVTLAVAILGFFSPPVDIFLASSNIASSGLDTPLVGSSFDSRAFATASAPPAPAAYAASTPTYNNGAPNAMEIPPVAVPVDGDYLSHKTAAHEAAPSYTGEEVARFCPRCGRRHVVEQGVKFCSGCGGELQH